MLRVWRTSFYSIIANKYLAIGALKFKLHVMFSFLENLQLCGPNHFGHTALNLEKTAEVKIVWSKTFLMLYFFENIITFNA